ncbi:hypothetical protein GB937_006181 [Aspergillus fischeri]|nr:hypothetical protein GB937_006181 [Aspergillus fischeri]
MSDLRDQKDNFFCFAEAGSGDLSDFDGGAAASLSAGEVTLHPIMPVFIFSMTASWRSLLRCASSASVMMWTTPLLSTIAAGSSSRLRMQVAPNSTGFGGESPSLVSCASVVSLCGTAEKSSKRGLWLSWVVLVHGRERLGVLPRLSVVLSGLRNTSTSSAMVSSSVERLGLDSPARKASSDCAGGHSTEISSGVEC